MNDINSAAEQPKTKRSAVLKALVAIGFSVFITLVVLAFAKEIERFKEMGYVGLFFINLAGSATIVLPAPAFVSVFALGNVLNPWLVGLVSGPAAALGEMTGYLAGYGGSAPVQENALYLRFDKWMALYGPLAIFVLAFIPNPLFDVAGLLAGASRMPAWQFLLACGLGKTLRYIFVAWAGFYGITWVRDLFA